MTSRLVPVPVVARIRVRPPVATATEVARPRLLTEVDGAGGPVTVVAATRGSGKTVLLAQWARTQASRCAWVSLIGGSEVGPIGIWVAVLEAFAELGRHPARRGPRLPRLSGVIDPGQIYDHVVPALLDGLVEDGAPPALVLDGVDAVVDPIACETLGYFLRELPSSVRVLVSCSRPPSMVPALRGVGHLRCLPADALRFTTDETRELLELATGGVVSSARSAELTASLHGWADGLRIAARDPAPGDGEVPASVLDHVRADFLDRAAPEERDVLLRCSVLPELRCESVAALAGGGAAGALDAFADGSLMLRRTSGGWVCHPLLRAAAAASLRRTAPELAVRLEVRAAELVTDLWPRSDPALVTEVVQPLESTGAADVPAVGAAAALAAGDTGRAARLLAVAGDGRARAAVRVLLHLQTGDLHAAGKAIAHTDQDASRRAATWDEAVVDLVVGALDLWAGRAEIALTALERAVATATHCGYLDVEVRALDHLVACAEQLGEPELAHAYATTASTRHASDPRRSIPPAIAAAYLASTGDRDHEAPVAGPASGRDPGPHAVAFSAYLRSEAARRAGDFVSFRRAQCDGRASLRIDTAGPLLRDLLDSGRGVPVDTLTARERVVLRALSGPLTLREIARELNVSHNTVKTQVRSLFLKLDVRDRASATRAARAR